jgi:hypothetical protein
MVQVSLPVVSVGDCWNVGMLWTLVYENNMGVI